jgi:hypothetical protein
MRHDAFIGQVQARARLDSRGSAERVTRASLETLGERVPSTVAEKAAAQLPHEIGEHLRRVAHAPGEPFTGERMTQADFFTRVAERCRHLLSQGDPRGPPRDRGGGRGHQRGPRHRCPPVPRRRTGIRPLRGQQRTHVRAAPGESPDPEAAPHAKFGGRVGRCPLDWGTC